MQRRQRSYLRGQQAAADELAPGDAAMQQLTQPKDQRLAPELKRYLGVCYRSTCLVKHKILEGMRLAEATVNSPVEWRSTTPTSVESAAAAWLAGARRTRFPRGRGADHRRRPASSGMSVATAVHQRGHGGLPGPVHGAAVDPGVRRPELLQGRRQRASAGPVHDREITGGGKASVLNEKFTAVNTRRGRSGPLRVRAVRRRRAACAKRR